MNRTLHQEIRHLEGLLMCWPRSLRIKQRLQELRAEQAREERKGAKAERAALRGVIFRALRTASLDTLRQLAAVVEG